MKSVVLYSSSFSEGEYEDTHEISSLYMYAGPNLRFQVVFVDVVYFYTVAFGMVTADIMYQCIVYTDNIDEIHQWRSKDVKIY